MPACTRAFPCTEDIERHVKNDSDQPEDQIRLSARASSLSNYSTSASGDLRFQWPTLALTSFENKRRPPIVIERILRFRNGSTLQSACNLRFEGLRLFLPRPRIKEGLRKCGAYLRLTCPRQRSAPALFARSTGTRSGNGEALLMAATEQAIASPIGDE